MDLHESIPLIQDFFHLTYVSNDGMAFGINFPAGIYVFTFVSFIASIGLAWYLWTVRTENFLLRLSLAFILAGAVGNLIDRILFGEVVDFHLRYICSSLVKIEFIHIVLAAFVDVDCLFVDKFRCTAEVNFADNSAGGISPIDNNKVPIEAAVRQKEFVAHLSVSSALSWC